jgi:hypothetical protein
MVAKKYLSLEEAASLLSVTTDELIRIRERGEVRGFADRGTWKFKSEDVAELRRRRQTDSNPEVPLLDDEDEAETLMGNPPLQEFASSVFDEEEGVNESETIVRKGPKPGSDSDVRLVLGDPSSRLSGSSADLPVMPAPGSDSDIRLVGEDLSHLGPGSDSDVKLIGTGDSSSEVELVDSDSDVRLTAGSDSDVKLVDSSSSDSGISLVSSGSLFEEEDDSITLPGDSGIRLAGDSGIGLKRPADSGILLEGPSSKFLAGDSGLRLGGDSSFKLAGGSDAQTLPDLAMSDDSGDEFGATSAMYSLKEDASGGTDVEVPLLDDDTYKVPSLGGGGRTGDTSVIMFDDDEAAELEGSAVELDDGDDIDEIEVAEDVLGEDDELGDLEVFGADDEDFDDDLASGASHADFIAGDYGMKMPAREVEWGGGTFALLGVSTVALILATVMGADLLQSVFAGGQTYSGLAGTIGGMLGN